MNGLVDQGEMQGEFEESMVDRVIASREGHGEDPSEISIGQVSEGDRVDMIRC